MSAPLATVVPHWPAPEGVSALVTTRAGGVSTPPFDALNLGAHVGDDPDAVAANRRRLALELGNARPVWLDQVHGIRVARLGAGAADGAPRVADASWTEERGLACAVLTADCLPVIFCDRAATLVAVAHCGWRGLCAGVLEAVLNDLPRPPGELLAWLGPGISQANYEVGDEVRAQFDSAWGARAATGFATGPDGRIRCDLAALARAELLARGVAGVYGGDLCSFGDPRFFSYRRDGRCGRMATLVWLEPRTG